MSVDGGYTSWSAWDTCSVTCGGGKQSSKRSCTNPAPQYGGANCAGAKTKSQDCNTHFCPSKCFLLVSCSYTLVFYLNYQPTTIYFNMSCLSLRLIDNITHY